MYFFKVWNERLFYVHRSKMTLKKSDLPVEMVRITENNVKWVTMLRGREYESHFKYQISLGDFGYYACIEGKPVGYGWIKHPGSDDYFYNIGAGCCYLCRFFVCEEVRGHNIYPMLISSLIENKKEFKSFYIGVEKGNIASENGLKKVGFEFIEEYKFIRVLRHTLNKKMIV